MQLGQTQIAYLLENEHALDDAMALESPVNARCFMISDENE
jgi:hypothetical protein